MTMSMYNYDDIDYWTCHYFVTQVYLNPVPSERDAIFSPNHHSCKQIETDFKSFIFRLVFKSFAAHMINGSEVSIMWYLIFFLLIQRFIFLSITESFEIIKYV